MSEESTKIIKDFKNISSWVFNSVVGKYLSPQIDEILERAEKHILDLEERIKDQTYEGMGEDC